MKDKFHLCFSSLPASDKDRGTSLAHLRNLLHELFSSSPTKDNGTVSTDNASLQTLVCEELWFIIRHIFLSHWYPWGNVVVASSSTSLLHDSRSSSNGSASLLPLSPFGISYSVPSLPTDMLRTDGITLLYYLVHTAPPPPSSSSPLPKEDSSSSLASSASLFLHTRLLPSSIYWEYLYKGLYTSHTNPQRRKTCLSILQSSMQYLHYHQSSLSLYSSILYTSWDTFLVLYNALEDFPLHLLDDIWNKRIQYLFPDNTNEIITSIHPIDCSTDSSVSPFLPSYFSSVPIPTYLTQPVSSSSTATTHSTDIPKDDPSYPHQPSTLSVIPREWACLIMDRALYHENPIIKRHILIRFTDLPLEYSKAIYSLADHLIDLLQYNLQPLSVTEKDLSLSHYALQLPTLASSSTDNSSSPTIITNPLVAPEISSIASYSSVAASGDSRDGSNITNEAMEFITHYHRTQRSLTNPLLPSSLATAIVSSDVTFKHCLGLRLPSWYISNVMGKHFLAALDDIALFAGGVEILGRNVYDFLFTYGLCILQGKIRGQRTDNSELLSPWEHFCLWIRTLIEGSDNAIGNNRVVAKWLYRILITLGNLVQQLTQTNPSSFVTTVNKPNDNPKLHVLTPFSLSHLRSQLTMISITSTRTYTETFYRFSIDVLCTLTDPLQLPIEDVCHTLSLYPSLHILRIYENTYLNKHYKVLQWILGTNTEASKVMERIHTLSQRIQYAVRKYLCIDQENGKGFSAIASSTSLPLSAAGIGRILILTQQAIEFYICKYPSQASILPKDYERQNLRSMTGELMDALTSIHSHVYMNETKRYRSILLSFSLLGAAWPSGSLGDIFLGPHMKGSCVPVQIPDIHNELYHEWTTVVRSFNAFYPTTVTVPTGHAKIDDGNGQSLPISPFEMEDYAEENEGTNDRDSKDMLRTAVQDFHNVHLGSNRLVMKSETGTQRNIRELFHNSSVSSELSSYVRSIINRSENEGNRKQENTNGIDGGTVSHSSFALAFLYTLRRLVPSNTHYEGVADSLVNMATYGVFEKKDPKTKEDEESEVARPIRWIRDMSILAILGPIKLETIIGSPRWNNDGSLVLDALLDYSVKKPQGFAQEKVGGLVWTTIYGYIDGCKWLLITAILRRYTLELKGNESKPFFDALPGDILERIVETAMDSMDYVSPQVMYSIMDLLGYLIRVITEKEQTEPYEQIKNAYNASLMVDGLSTKSLSTKPVILKGTTLEKVLSIFERKLGDKKLSKRFVLAYAVNIMQPCLWLRPHLHLPQGTFINSDGTLVCENGSNKPGLLVNHVQTVFDSFSYDRRPVFCMQIFAARLVSLWKFLIEIADGTCKYIPSNVEESINVTDLRQQAKGILLSNLSLMQHLLLFRENRGFQEDSPINDYDAREQFRSWFNKNKSTGGTVDVGLSQAKARIDFEVAQRGSGSVSRIQMLCFIDTIARSAFTKTKNSAMCELLCRAILSRFARLASSKVFKAKPGTEVNPGTVAHMIRLRSYQAIGVIVQHFGKGCRSIPNDSFYYNSIVDLCTVAADPETRQATIKLVEDEASAILSQFPSWIQDEDILAPRVGHSASTPKVTPKTKSSSFLSTAEGFQADYTVHKYSLPSIVYALLKATINSQLAVPLPPSLRHYMEVMCTGLLRRFPFLGTHMLLSLLKISDIHGQLALSSNLIACDLILHLTRILYDQAYNQRNNQPIFIDTQLIPSIQSIVHTLIIHIFPWMINPTGIIRIISQATFMSVVPLLYGEPNSSASSSSDNSSLSSFPPLLPASAGISEWVYPMYTSMISSSHIRNMAHKQVRNFRRIDPTLSGTLESLLSSPASEHGELLPIDAVGCFKVAFHIMTQDLHGEQNLQLEDTDHLYPRVEASISSGLVPSLARYDPTYRANFGLMDEEGGLGYFGMNPKWNKGNTDLHDHSDVSTSVSIMNFQRKIAVDNETNEVNTNIEKRNNPSNIEPNKSTTLKFSEADPGAIAYGENDPDAMAMLQATAAQKGAGLLSDLSPLLTGLSIPDGRRYQPLIVVASYVSRVPNLAGLARTCEIFGIQSLVVPDKDISKDPAFRSISVTASDWLSIHECKPEYVIDFIRARKYQGYQIIALEQAARSVRLGTKECQLPEKSVLVLGAEKEGVPIDVLNEVDIVVEIPQFGLLRSLNVHVSGSLLIWEYTRQRMAKLSQKDTSTTISSSSSAI